MSRIFAAFAIARAAGDYSGAICATTRPDGTVGLPGGKVEPGEAPWIAVLRESAEEGWAVEHASSPPEPIRVALVGGREVAWYLMRPTAEVVQDHKEAYRGILPITCQPGDLSPGLGNEFLQS